MTVTMASGQWTSGQWTRDSGSSEVEDRPEEEYELDERTVLHLARAVLAFLEQVLTITVGSLGATAIIDLTQYLRGY